MSRERVLGQQVQVYIYTNDGQKPLIVNFDSINDEKIITNHSYKTIGKKFSRKHNISDGYTINLKREKTDHYIQEILKMMDALTEDGQQHLELMVKKITNHSVTLETIDPEKEFRIVNTSSENPLIQSLINGTVKRGLTGLANGVLNNLNPIQQGVVSNIQRIITTKTLIERLFAVRYTEEEIYKNCSVAGYNSSTESRSDTSVENLRLESTNRTFIVPDNKYSRYFQDAIVTSNLEDFDRQRAYKDELFSDNLFVNTLERQSLATINNRSFLSTQAIIDELNRLND